MLNRAGVVSSLTCGQQLPDARRLFHIRSLCVLRLHRCDHMKLVLCKLYSIMCSLWNVFFSQEKIPCLYKDVFNNHLINEKYLNAKFQMFGMHHQIHGKPILCHCAVTLRRWTVLHPFGKLLLFQWEMQACASQRVSVTLGGRGQQLQRSNSLQGTVCFFALFWSRKEASDNMWIQRVIALWGWTCQTSSGGHGQMTHPRVFPDDWREASHPAELCSFLKWELKPSMKSARCPSMIGRSSVHILAGEESIRLRKAGETPLCSCPFPQLCFLQENTHLTIQVHSAGVLSCRHTFTSCSLLKMSAR